MVQADSSICLVRRVELNRFIDLITVGPIEPAGSNWFLNHCKKQGYLPMPTPPRRRRRARREAPGACGASPPSHSLSPQT